MMKTILVAPGGAKAVVDDAYGRESVRYHCTVLLAARQILSDA
jgi:hypothetical protein